MNYNDQVKVANNQLKKQTKSNVKEGIVYLLRVDFDGVIAYKIGITTKKIQDRVSEILVSAFATYRVFLFCKPIKFSKCENYFAVEAKLHRYFSENKYWPRYRFGGSNEFFNVDEDVLVEVYIDAMNGVDIECEDYPDYDTYYSIIELERLNNREELGRQFENEASLIMKDKIKQRLEKKCEGWI